MILEIAAITNFTIDIVDLGLTDEQWSALTPNEKTTMIQKHLDIRYEINLNLDTYVER